MAVGKLEGLLNWSHGRPHAHVPADVPHTTSRHAHVSRPCQTYRVY
ncbi:hypothetical protein F383_26971 [Gossypium arboreum]|uniref:Uncharacterized protein n=1 Tax=Gossypium arboreum TaxID=29729 RepID=A0A0B0MVY4_GOSAR|nr:hypothetical protein F383_26971 [Gossypium arboreum]